MRTDGLRTDGLRADRRVALPRAQESRPALQAAKALDLAGLRVALIHDWLTGMRGGERCLEVFLKIFPRAEIFTLFHFPGSVSPAIEERPIHTSPLQHLPWMRRRYRHYLPLFPWAVRSFDLSGFDLIFSSSHCVAKGVRAHGLPHICYCHTPMRYVWDRFDDYFGPGRPVLTRMAARLLRAPLQRWDRRSTREVTHFMANSAYVAGRIRRYYDRDAEVVHPPVDTQRFGPTEQAEDFYLIVSALAPYKLVELAVRAFQGMKRRLLIVGKGQDEGRLKRLAADNVEFLGWQGDDTVTSLMSRCRAFLLPGEEDFGITPLEAMASGRPVIALGRGGALETVVDLDAADSRAPTGVLFPEPTVEDLAKAVDRFESNLHAFDPRALRSHAETFSTSRFRREVEAAVIRALSRRVPEETR